MFYLPNGDGAEVVADVPAAVLHPNGPVQPSALALNATAPSTVHISWNTGGVWSAEEAERIDADRSPAPVLVPGSAPQAVRLRRERGVTDPVVVTASWL
jgi:hypothetical protein